MYTILVFFGMATHEASASTTARAYAQTISGESLPTLKTISPLAIINGIDGVGLKIEKNALVPENIQTLIDDDEFVPEGNEISTYTVADGDTISSIAEKFGVSANTIRWANNLEIKSSVKVGQSLVILPTTGVKHRVVKGDTVTSLAKKYKADARDIAEFNGMTITDGLTIGDIIIIPDGDGSILAEKQAETKKGSKSTTKTPAKKGRIIVDTSGSSNGYFIRPMRGIKTQGFHGPYNAVDIGAPVGTPIAAAADGVVITTKSPSGWNGGYGGLTIISHPNGSQSLYAHQSRIDVTPGQTVTQGEQIGLSGNTGRSTGPHLHLEFRGIKTPSLY